MTLKERLAAKEKFGDSKAQEYIEDLKKSQKIQKEKQSMTKEEKARREKALKLKQMIENAETLEEIAKIEAEMEKGGYDDFLLLEDEKQDL